MTTSCYHTCPLRARLERAKACYRAQQAEIARLQDLLDRHRRIGLCRYHQPPAQALYGTQVWSENVLLRRALSQREATIQQQARLIAALKTLLREGDPQRENQGVA